MEEITVTFTKDELMSLNAALSIIETLAPSILAKPNVKTSTEKLINAYLNKQ